MQTSTTFGPEKIVKSTTSPRAAQIRLMTIPYQAPVYLVCFGHMDQYGFNGNSWEPAKTCATEGRAMKAAQKWVNA